MTRTAVITGGAGGLGRALATGLQAQGWFTALVDLRGQMRDADTPQQAFYGCDLTDRTQLASVAAQICTDRPSVDLVIYNAGVTQIAPFASADMDAHRRVFEINYFAAVACAQEFLLPVRQAKGTHLAISSVAGFAPLTNRTSYCASKHALEGFFKTLRSEEREFGVHTAIAAPSFVATNTDNAETDASGISRPGSATDGVDYMSPEDAAGVILAGLQKRRDFVPVGRVAQLASLANRLSPRFYQARMERTIQD